MEPKGSFPPSQERTTVPYPEPQRCGAHIHNLIYKIHFNIILQISHKLSFTLAFSCLKLLVKPNFQGLLSNPVSNITHAQHFHL